MTDETNNTEKEILGVMTGVLPLFTRPVQYPSGHAHRRDQSIIFR